MTGEQTTIPGTLIPVTPIGEASASEPVTKKLKIVSSKPKDRELAEIRDLPIKALSESEKGKLIHALEDELAIARTHIEGLEQAATSAFKKARFFEDKYNKLKAEAQAKLASCLQFVKTAHMAISLASVLEEQ